MLNGKPLTTQTINSAETIAIDLTSFDLAAEDIFLLRLLVTKLTTMINEVRPLKQSS